MKDDVLGFSVLALLVLVMVIMMSVGITNEYVTYKWQRQAIQSGHAEYVAGERGEPVFKWREGK